MAVVIYMIPRCTTCSSGRRALHVYIRNATITEASDTIVMQVAAVGTYQKSFSVSNTINRRLSQASLHRDHCPWPPRRLDPAALNATFGFDP